jgi:hypothetical protein
VHLHFLAFWCALCPEAFPWMRFMRSAHERQALMVIANRPPPCAPGQVGIEQPGAEREAALVLTLERGALATSGDSRRFLQKDSVRYGHILDPRAGWPAPNPPRSVTVAASSCTKAGLVATMATLQGRGRRVSWGHKRFSIGLSNK